MNNIIKGFTLIELLVVIAVLGILTAIVVSSLGEARVKAKDQAVVATMRNFRTSVEVEFINNSYDDLCTSDIYNNFNSYVAEQGGSVDLCDADDREYILLATLPSGNQASSFINQAFAQTSPVTFSGETVLCTNARGSLIQTTATEFNELVTILNGINDAKLMNRTIVSPYCTAAEAQADYPEIVIEDNESGEGEESSYLDFGWVCEGGSAVCGGFINPGDDDYDVVDFENCVNPDFPMPPPSCAPAKKR